MIRHAMTPVFAPVPAPAPILHHPWWVPTTTTTTTTTTTATASTSSNQSISTTDSSKPPVDFSPPLIAMVVVVAAAFLVITYSRLISHYLLRILRRWRIYRHRRRRLLHLTAAASASSDIDSLPPPFFDSPTDDGFHLYSPYGLDDSVIKTIPLSLYSKNSTNTKHKRSNSKRDCAVCLLEFDENDYVRTLPACAHFFHVDCIDMWLRSHANCPLCRAGIFRPESPFVPIMAARIRPSLDDAALHSIIDIDGSLGQSRTDSRGNHAQVPEITPCVDEERCSPRRVESDHHNRFVLKRSYSFGFERSSVSDRMLVTEPVTASPWRYRRGGGGGGGGGGFWSKRPSPFGSLSKARVFSFRYYRGMKSSPFFRRRISGGGFFPFSERFTTTAYGGGGGGSSRRSKSMASPMFLRSSMAAFSSSRLRCGDPEALLSPERFKGR